MASATTAADITTVTADTATVAADNRIRNGTVILILVVFFAAAIIFNVILIVLFATRKRLRNPANYLLVSIAVADILSAFLWILPAMVTVATWTWLFGIPFCQFAGFAATLLYGVNMFTLLAVALERFMKFWSPSRHKLAFTKVITAILVSTLWIFSALFAVIPLAGWANYDYIAPRLGCVMNFGLSYSLLDFYTVAGYTLPTLLGALFFILIFVKLAVLRCKRNSAGEPILEERRDRIGESYGQRFRRQEEKYRDVARKSRKPTFRKSPENSVSPAGGGPDTNLQTPTVDSDNEYDLSDDVESDDEKCFTDYADVIRRRREKERRLHQTRRYRLHRRDVSMTLTIFIVWLIYVALWLPYVILNYIWILGYYPEFGDRTTHIIIMVMALASVIYKPLVYLCNGRIRSVIKSGFTKRRTGNKTSG